MDKVKRKACERSFNEQRTVPGNWDLVLQGLAQTHCRTQLRIIPSEDERLWNLSTNFHPSLTKGCTQSRCPCMPGSYIYLSFCSLREGRTERQHVHLMQNKGTVHGPVSRATVKLDGPPRSSMRPHKHLQQASLF